MKYRMMSTKQLSKLLREETDKKILRKVVNALRRRGHWD